jgi:hypothetical protein
VFRYAIENNYDPATNSVYYVPTKYYEDDTIDIDYRNGVYRAKNNSGTVWLPIHNYKEYDLADFRYNYDYDYCDGASAAAPS